MTASIIEINKPMTTSHKGLLEVFQTNRKFKETISLTKIVNWQGTIQTWELTPIKMNHIGKHKKIHKGIMKDIDCLQLERLVIRLVFLLMWLAICRRNWYKEMYRPRKGKASKDSRYIRGNKSPTTSLVAFLNNKKIIS